MSTVKKCSTCEILKEYSEFHKNKSKLDGYNNVCKACKSNYHKGFKKENKRLKLAAEGKKKCGRCKEIKPIDQFFKDKSAPDKLCSYCKECCITYNRLHAQKHRKKFPCKMCVNMITRGSYCDDCRPIHKRAKHREYERNKRKTDTEYRLKNNISRSVREMLALQSSKKSWRSVLDFLSYTPKELKLHLESLFELWMTWENHGKYDVKTWDDNDPSTWKWQIDHVVAHSKFRYASMDCEEFRQCWTLSNLQPLSAKQNMIKGKK